jgi:hypothetical protein
MATVSQSYAADSAFSTTAAAAAQKRLCDCVCLYRDLDDNHREIARVLLRMIDDGGQTDAATALIGYWADQAAGLAP